MSKHLESLYQNLLNGKLPHNLSWSEAVELVEHLGEVQPHGGDEFVFRAGSQRVFFKRPQTHDLGLEEVSRLRKFLKEAGPSSREEAPAQPGRMIVVIDLGSRKEWAAVVLSFTNHQSLVRSLLSLKGRGSIG